MPKAGSALAAAERPRAAAAAAGYTPAPAKLSNASGPSARSAQMVSPTKPAPRPAAMVDMAMSPPAELSTSRMRDAPLRPPAGLVLESPAPQSAGASASSTAAAALPAPVALQPFLLAVTYAREHDIARIPPHLQALPVAASPGQHALETGMHFMAPIGRLHQPDFFEAWLPDMSLRSCLSRNAFELRWSRSLDDVRILSLGTHPLSVDGKVLPKNTQGAVSMGSEIRLTFENKVLLCLKLALSPPLRVGRVTSEVADTQSAASFVHATIANPPVVPQLVAPVVDARDGMQEAEAQAPALAKALRTLEAARAERRSLRESSDCAAGPQAVGGAVPQQDSAPMQKQVSAQCPKMSPWRLACLHAEGLDPNEASRTLPAEVAAIELPEGLSQIGRHHQPRHFAMWLKDPGVRFGSLSATHLDAEVHDRGLKVRTVSASGMVYIGRELLRAGDVHDMRAGELLSFSRTNGTVDEAFLVLQLLRQPGSDAAIAMPAASTAPSSSPSRPCGSPPPPVAGVCDGANAAVALTRAGGDGRATSTLAKGAVALAGVSAGARPLVVLELMGDGAQEQLRLEQRRIGPVPLGDEPLLVGRRFQPELHESGIKPDFQKLVSSDQFCIALSGGEFWLLVLAEFTSVWHVRPSMLTCNEVPRDTLVTLLPKDEICLGPGLYWRFDVVGEASRGERAPASLAATLR